jgi:NAD(P)-dependent dehydrogenase (short-subunit alcohol dehydrogenase family)
MDLGLGGRAVAAFLCSERASFVSGVTIPVDGGACKGLL